MKKYSLYIVAIVLLAALGAFTMSIGKQAVHAQGIGTPLKGWAWSSNIGWVSFNSADNNTGTGGSGNSASAYDVAVDGSGNLTGYAWSPNIGWISFNQSDLTGCTGTTGANVNNTSGAVTGWIRVLGAQGSTTDGWDGCVELSGTNHPSPDTSGYQGTSTKGVTVGIDSGNANTYGRFSGFAWGGNVLGWLSFGAFSPVGGGGCTGPGCGLCDPAVNPLCQGGGTTDLVLQAQDTGPGSPAGTGNWFANSISYTIPSLGGSVTVPVQWIPNSATSIQTASTSPLPGIATDWGENSGLTSSPSPNVLPFSSQGQDQFTFTNPGPNPITKKLILSYFLLGVGVQSKMLTITINPYNNIVNNPTCNRPAHTNICTSITGATGPASIWGSASAPQCSGAATPSCNFYCSSTYVLKNGSCVKSSIQEI